MPQRSPHRIAARPGRTPWLLAGVAGLGALALLLVLYGWAPEPGLGFVTSHPLAALLCLALLALALAVAARAWPRRRAPTLRKTRPARAEAAAEVPGPASPEWTRLVQGASAALARRGIATHGLTERWAPGTDLLLRHQGQPYLVCARHWRAKLIDGTAVRALALDIARHHAVGGMLLSTSQAFTAQARQLVQLHGIDLPGRPAAPRAAAAAAATRQAGPTAGRASRTHPMGRAGHADLVTTAPTAAPQAPPARARAMPQLRDDQDVARARRPLFAPTVPMSAEELERAVPGLRPDDVLPTRRADFLPTVPMERADRAMAVAGGVRQQPA